MRLMKKLTTTSVLALILVALPLAAQTPRSNPEGAGLSGERLKRVSERRPRKRIAEITQAL